MKKNAAKKQVEICLRSQPGKPKDGRGSNDNGFELLPRGEDGGTTLHTQYGYVPLDGVPVLTLQVCDGFQF